MENKVSDDYISFYKYGSVYCGGAHPSHIVEGYNFDIKKRIGLGDLSMVYPNLNYFEIIKQKYESKSDLDEECEYFSLNKENWDYITWVFTEKGIEITPMYPHVLTPCEIPFLITYKELEKK